MELRCLSLPPLGTNAYLLLCPERHRAALFDAPDTAFARIQPFLRKAACQLHAVYLTHGHWDHMMDVARFNEAGIPVYGHEADYPLVQYPELQAEYMIPGLGVEPGRLDQLLVDGQRLDILGSLAEVRHAPGHSPGSLLYWFPDLEIAITGDVIFQGGIGRTDFPGCSFEQLARSIREKIYTLPEQTVLYPGHGPSTRVEDEKQTNPYVCLKE